MIEKILQYINTNPDEGSKDTAIKVYEILKQYSIKGHIEIAVYND